MSFNLSGFTPDFFENGTEEVGPQGNQDGGPKDPSSSVAGFQIPAEEDTPKPHVRDSFQSQMSEPPQDPSNFLASFDEHRVQPTMLGKQQPIDFDHDDSFDRCDDGITEDMESKRLKMT